MNDKYHNNRKSNAIPLLRGRLLIALACCQDRGRGDPAGNGHTLKVQMNSVSLCVHSVSSVVKNRLYRGELLSSHRELGALISRSNPYELHPECLGLAGGNA